MTTANKKYYDSMSGEPEMNADMGIVVPLEKIKACNLTAQAMRN